MRRFIFVGHRLVSARLVLLAAACGGGGPTTSAGSTASTGTSTATSVSTPPPPPPPATLDTTAGATVGDGSGGAGTVGTTVGTTLGLDATGSSGDVGSQTSSSSGSSGGSSGGTSTGAASASSSTSGDGGAPFVCPEGGGMACDEPADCASNACFVVGVLGGVCSECDEDADCEFGCNPANPLDGSCAVCCDGSPGCGCESAAACQPDLRCAPLLNVPGILDVSTCSVCQSDVDCDGGDLCTPSYDLNELSGQHECRAPGTVPNGEGCDFDGSGDAQCTSGHCAQILLMGLPVAATCSECTIDADCPGGVCVPPELMFVGDMTEVVPGMCV